MSVIEINHGRDQERSRLERRAKQLAWLGEGWHVAEMLLALVAGAIAGSIALTGFALQSGVEILAGLLLVWRFSSRRFELPERRAQQLMAAVFLALGLFVAAAALSSLVNHEHPATSLLGIAIAAIAIMTMPLLAAAKRRVGRRLHSVATIKEAEQNQLCAYLAVALLAGLVLNAAWSLWWADAAAALVIATVSLRESRESWLGRGCCAGCEHH